MGIDFTGIKLGDIDGNVATQMLYHQPTEVRKPWAFWFEDKVVAAGDKVVTPVYANETHLIQGMQWQLEANGLTITEY
ncbi:MAG: hypothetical protein IPO65_11940 [Saprospiraceae bacterium]|nr:hypothetical protein [Saprospiraceae bacterium]